MATPSTSEAKEVTRLLLAWSARDRTALERLIPLVHRELQRLAHRYLRDDRAGHILQTTALVYEAYLRLVNVKEVSLQSRAQFFGLAAQVMRNTLVDFARSRPRLKDRREAQHVSLDEALTISRERSPDLVALDEALNALAEAQSQRRRARLFGGAGTSLI